MRALRKCVEPATAANITVQWELCPCYPRSRVLILLNDLKAKLYFATQGFFFPSSLFI